MGFILSEIPVFFLIASKGCKQFLLSLFVFVIITVIAFAIHRKQKKNFGFNFYYPLLALIISLLLAAFFYCRWSNSGRIQLVSSFIHLPLRQSCILLSLVLALLSLPGIDNLLKVFIPNLPGYNARSDTESLSEKYIVFYIFLTAFLVMFLNSRCSPLYPFNDWVDPNTMFTVGKGVLKGFVPYRDLYEQKGPLLIFLHTFGALVSYDSFHGVWLIEIVSCFIFLYLAYKLTKLLYDRDSFLIIPVIAAVVYGTSAFRAGDTAEEYSLPLLLYALYVGIKSLKTNKLPNYKEFFLIGITSGCVFWMKYSLTGFYIGWFLVFLVMSLKNRTLKSFCRGIILIMIGVLLIGIPFIIYFAINSAIKFFYEAYFYNNLFYYSNNANSFNYRMLFGYYFWTKYSPAPMICTCLSPLWIILNKKWKYFQLICLTFFSTYLFIFIGGVNHGYTSLILSVFSIFGILLLLDLFGLIRSLWNKLTVENQSLSVCLMMISLIALIRFSYNMKFLEFPREKMFQFQMAEIIERSKNPNPTVFYYKIGDVGVNTVAKLIPELRFFCDYNNDRMTEISESQNECIKNKCADYIISRSKFENVHPNFSTYDYQGWIVGMADETLEFFHYFTPKRTEL